MQNAAIQLNPKSSLQVLSVGEERTPVLVIDNFALDTGDVVDYACHFAKFGADATSAYPGIRTALTRGYVATALNALYPLLAELYSVPASLKMTPRNAVYSLINTPENELRLLQRLPHFDSSDPYFFAITHYLGAGEFGGTGFYRHKPTGFETVTGSRLAQYIEAGDRYIAEHGEPPQRYFGAGDDHFELYAQVDYRPNRLLAYPGSMLHSGLVEPGRDINADPRSGRLTANVFVEFRHTASRNSAMRHGMPR
jgi:hypothetical protein